MGYNDWQACACLQTICCNGRHLGNVKVSLLFGVAHLRKDVIPQRILNSFLSLQCTVTCGGGVQTRSVHCVQQGRPSSSCLHRQKPPVLRACNTNFCPALEKRGKGPRPKSASLLLRGWVYRKMLPRFVQGRTWEAVTVKSDQVCKGLKGTFNFRNAAICSLKVRKGLLCKSFFLLDTLLNLKRVVTLWQFMQTGGNSEQ